MSLSKPRIDKKKWDESAKENIQAKETECYKGIDKTA
jgi:hypothetical protein